MVAPWRKRTKTNWIKTREYPKLPPSPTADCLLQLLTSCLVTYEGKQGQQLHLLQEFCSVCVFSQTGTNRNLPLRNLPCQVIIMLYINTYCTLLLKKDMISCLTIEYGLKCLAHLHNSMALIIEAITTDMYKCNCIYNSAVLK